MSSISRHLRSLLIALAVLALSATVAFAGRPDSAAPVHADAQGPAATETSDGDEGEAPETDAPETDAPETEAPETEAPETEAPETEAPETKAPETKATDVESAEHPDNHGKLVSEAAQTETPEGYDNHGAWVRTVARDNNGHSADKAAAKQARKTKP